MKLTQRSSVILMLLAVGSILAWSAEDATAQAIQQQGEVAYLTGGVGADEREELERLAPQEGMTLKVSFANARGSFLAGIPVTIQGDDGSVRLEVTTDGPWLFARLPAGEYRVEAEFEGHRQDEEVSVPESGMARLLITFP